MAWKTKRFWVLFMALVCLELASGDVWRNRPGPYQLRDSLYQSKKQSQFQPPVAVSGTDFDDGYLVGPQAGSSAFQSQLLDSSSSSVTSVHQGHLQPGFSGSYKSVQRDASGQTAVSHGPLQKLKSRLFTGQSAGVVSSWPMVAKDLPQKTGSPPLTVPSQNVGTWQPSSSLKAGFQVGSGAPGASLNQHGPGNPVSRWPVVTSDFPQNSGTPTLTVPSRSVGTWLPSSSLKQDFQVGHGAPGARVDQYSNAGWTTASYDPSQGLSSGFGVQKTVQRKPGFPFAASGSTQSQRSPASQTSSDWSSAAVSPSLTFSQDFSEWSLKPVPQKVPSQYDYSVKH